MPAFAGMTAEETSYCVLAARIAPELCQHFALVKQEGAGKAGHRLMPVAPVREKCTGQEPQVQPDSTGLPRANGVTAYTYSPRCAGLVSHRRRPAHRPSDLASASGCQDHTTSPSAAMPIVLRKSAWHRDGHRIPRSTSVTIAKRPSQ